jgi:hypothetical protein
MSTLKTNNIEHLDASTPSIQTTIGGGTILAGVSTVSGTLSVGSGTSISSPATNTLALGTNNAERLRITSAGKVGIGTDNPVGNLEIRDTKANLIVAKNGLTVKSNSDLATQYDLIQLGAGGAIASYSTATATADTQFIHNAYRHSGGNFKYRYTDSAARIRMNSPAGSFRFENATSGSADADITFSERLRITSDGNVGVGILTPTSLLHLSDSSATTTEMIKLRNYASSVNSQPSITFEAVTAAGQGANSHIRGLAGTDAGGLNNENASGIQFDVRYGGGGTLREAAKFTTAGNLKFPSGQGIDFSATGDGSGTSASELLDDYEEGTWSPIFSTNTNGASGQTYVAQLGSYKKIGAIVNCFFDMGLSSLGTFGGTYITLGGLPYTNFPAGNIGGCMIIGYYSGFNLPTNCTTLTTYSDAGHAYIMTPSDNSGANYLQVSQVSSEMTSSSRLIGQITLNLAS